MPNPPPRSNPVWVEWFLVAAFILGCVVTGTAEYLVRGEIYVPYRHTPPASLQESLGPVPVPGSERFTR